MILNRLYPSFSPFLIRQPEHGVRYPALEPSQRLVVLDAGILLVRVLLGVAVGAVARQHRSLHP